jgi:hypothetical protein
MKAIAGPVMDPKRDQSSSSGDALARKLEQITKLPQPGSTRCEEPHQLNKGAHGFDCGRQVLLLSKKVDGDLSADNEFALLVDLGDHVAQGRIGDPHKADQRCIQLKDKKDRARDRE